MRKKIKAEIWDGAMKKCESVSSFSTVEAFVAHAKKFKSRKDSARLRVHIPGSIELSASDKAMIESLGITRF